LCSLIWFAAGAQIWRATVTGAQLLPVLTIFAPTKKPTPVSGVGLCALDFIAHSTLSRRWAWLSTRVPEQKIECFHGWLSKN
jgi:hypothetical protein